MVHFNSRKTEYKKPFGALRAGDPLTLRLQLENEPPCSTVRVIFRYENGEGASFFLRKETDGFFSGEITLSQPGLCFYRFEACLEAGGVLFIGTSDGVHATVGDWLPEWRLVVFSADFQTPESLKGGIWYQIFPDRFRIGAPAPARSARSPRIYHENWEERPLFTQDRPDFAGNDFFGGNLAGIAEKLPYLAALGVDLLYLNPIFESGENHRYSTGDYERVDPLLGTNEDFEALCAQAKKLGIRIVLDGVFSHTGANSRYFNKDGLYPDLGAYQSKESPYYSWYHFSSYPDCYDCWWGFGTLPCVDETEKAFLNYICGPSGIAAQWMKHGAYGWRLDVADELPDAFLELFRARVKEENPQSVIIGEVWENAVEKVSYGARRRFLLGSQCDTVMNYPWLEAIVGLLKSGNTAVFYEEIMEILEEYPPAALSCLMNILSTHDTPRILNRLGAEKIPPRQYQADNYLTPEQRENGIALLKKAALLQFSLPGVPCIFYGDEVGMEGYGDPYCRGTYPWGKENQMLLFHYQKLGQLRKRYQEDFAGAFQFERWLYGQLQFRRGTHLLVAMNFSGEAFSVEGIPLFAEGYDEEQLLPGGYGWFLSE